MDALLSVGPRGVPEAAEAAPSPGLSHTPGAPLKPLCYICGIELELAGLRAHLKGCLGRWLRVQQLLPVALRQPLCRPTASPRRRGELAEYCAQAASCVAQNC
eukprot:RCo012942